VFDELVPAVYGELKRIASRQLRDEAVGHTLQTTALVNEAYVRLARERRISAKNRVEFFGVASHAMRRVLVDYARKRKATKRGGGAEHVPLDAVEEFLGDREADEVLALDRALDVLSELSPRAASEVQLRYFAGLTAKESAELLAASMACMSNAPTSGSRRPRNTYIPSSSGTIDTFRLWCSSRARSFSSVQDSDFHPRTKRST
jgi:RNA polymerase sigma-70 factor (ECF subfamily)